MALEETTSFDDALRAVIAAGGDTDTIGATASALLGVDHATWPEVHGGW